MKLLKIKKIILGLVTFLPITSFAQILLSDPRTGESANTIIMKVVVYIQDYGIPIVIGIALLAFLWGVMKYGTSRDDESRKESIAIIINGIIILFVMVSLWGLVWIFASFFEIDLSGPTNLQDKTIHTDSLIIK
jgi:hypothetical protein